MTFVDEFTEQSELHTGIATVAERIDDRTRLTAIAEAFARLADLGEPVVVGGGLRLNIVTKTGTYALTLSDFGVGADLLGGAFTFDLPDLNAADGQIYIIKKLDSSVNALTLDGFGTQTIDDNLTITLTVKDESVTLQGDKANLNWRIG